MSRDMFTSLQIIITNYYYKLLLLQIRNVEQH